MIVKYHFQYQVPSSTDNWSRNRIRREIRPVGKFLPDKPVLDVPILSNEDLTKYSVLFKLNGKTKKIDAILSLIPDNNYPANHIKFATDSRCTLFAAIYNDLATLLPISDEIPNIDEKGTSNFLLSLNFDPAASRVIHGHFRLEIDQAMGPTSEPSLSVPLALREYVTTQGGFLMHWHKETLIRRETSEIIPYVAFTALLPVGSSIGENITLNPESKDSYCYFCKEVGHHRSLCTKPDPCRECGSQTHPLVRCPVVYRVGHKAQFHW